MFPDPEKRWLEQQCVCVVSVFCVCVCVCARRGKRGSRLCSRCQQEKTRKSNAKSPHKESENHKNIRIQTQCNDIVILATKPEVKSNCRVWNLFQRLIAGETSILDLRVYGNTDKYIYIYIYIYTYIHIIYIYIYV